MTTDAIIEEMQEIKANHQALDIQDILKILNIRAIRDLTIAINKR